MRISRASGFTLIELMVVVAIIGIIASVAYPSYNDHVRKTRRTAGEACALAAAQQMERYYTAKLTYDPGPTSFTCDPDATKYYSVASSNLGAKTYTITITPIGQQAGDSCGSMTVDQAGTKSPATAGCW